MKCGVCKKELDDSDAYEYRGAYGCADHFDEVCAKRDRQRQAAMDEENRRTERFRGLDMSKNTAIGRANRQLLNPNETEGPLVKEYELRSKGESK